MRDSRVVRIFIKVCEGIQAAASQGKRPGIESHLHAGNFVKTAAMWIWRGELALARFPFIAVESPITGIGRTD